MIIVLEEDDFFKNYIKRFSVVRRENEVEENLKKDKEISFFERGVGFSIYVENNFDLEKNNGVIELFTDKEYVDFYILSEKKIYIDKPLYVKNNVILKRKANNCFSIRIYRQGIKEEVLKLNIIVNKSFYLGKNMNISLDFKILSYGL